MKKFTFLWCFLLGFGSLLNAQHLTSEEELKLLNSQTTPILSHNELRNVDILLDRLSNLGHQVNGVEEFFSQNEVLALRSYFSSQTESIFGGPCDQAIEITSGNIVNELLICGPGDLLNSGNFSPFCEDDFGPGGEIPGFYGGGIEATYTYTPGSTGTATLTVNQTTWAMIQVFENGCPLNGGTCVTGARATGDTRTVTWEAEEGIEYFIWIDTWPAPPSPCANGGQMTFTGPEPSGGGGGTGVPTAFGINNATPSYGYFEISNPAVFNGLSTGSGTAAFEGAGAIDHDDNDTAYVIDNAGAMWSVDVQTGVYTSLGNVGVNDMTGLEFNPVDGNLYGTTLTGFYSIDIGAVSATLIGNLNTPGGLAVALAIDGDGNAYTYDVADDTLYSINTATGAATAIGNIGFDANFGQGMAWDAETDQIYMAAFNNTIFDSELRLVNTTTGNTTSLGTINPGPLTQIGWVSIINSESGGGNGPFPSPYCGPLPFTIDVEPISLVNVADIDNVSSAVLNGTPAHEDFTDIIGNMEAGESYSIALEGNTGGNWENRFVVFIDWNQNGVLNDPGEVYEMNNTITNSTGTDGQQALGTITVPSDALAGETRMRVKKIFGTANFLDPCSGAGFGQAEDYTINVIVPDPCLVEMFPFTETFEANSPSRDCWTQIQEIGAGNWTFATGSSGGAITTANSGALNARFVSAAPSMGGTPVTKLVSPPMDLVELVEAEMTFFYGQEVWAGDQNFLRIYYRVSSTDPWVEIAFYNTNVPSWTEVTLSLPNVSSTYQVAFEGINNWGRANVIDDVTIKASPPPNDLIENAISVTEEDQPYTDPGVRMQYATNELLNPDGCNIAGTNGVWYSFTASADGTAEASITTPSGTSAVIFYEAPSEAVGDETDLIYNFEWSNQCAPGTEATITTTAGQSYYIFVLNTGGSSDVVIDISSSLSTGDNTIDGFTFYPNPTMDILNLRSNISIDNVELFNMLGQKVISQVIGATTSQVDVSELATGTYLMKVSAEGQTATYQVIKK